MADKIVARSDGEIETEQAELLALKCVAYLDFNDKYQMHRPLENYADAIIGRLQRNSK